MACTQSRRVKKDSESSCSTCIRSVRISEFMEGVVGELIMCSRGHWTRCARQRGRARLRCPPTTTTTFQSSAEAISLLRNKSTAGITRLCRLKRPMRSQPKPVITKGPSVLCGRRHHYGSALFGHCDCRWGLCSSWKGVNGSRRKAFPLLL